MLLEHVFLQLLQRGTTREGPVSVVLADQSFVQPYPRPLESQTLTELVDELGRSRAFDGLDGGRDHTPHAERRRDRAERFGFFGEELPNIRNGSLVTARVGGK